MAFPTLLLEIAPGSKANDQFPSWSDITSRLISFDVKHGRQYELVQMQTGTGSFVLDNADRVLDPTYTLGPYSGKLLPHIQIRFSATISGTTYRLFRGFIERFTLTYAGIDSAQVTLDCVDMLAALSQATITGSFVQQLSGARILAVLAAAGWPTTLAPTMGWTLGTSALGTNTALGVSTPVNALDAGKAVMAAHTVDPVNPESALEHIQEVADSEPGYFFFNGAGQAVFLDRSRFTPTAPAAVMTFSDDPASVDSSHVCYADLVFNPADIDRVKNDIELTAEAGALTSLTDAASVDRYWRLTLNRATHLRDATSDPYNQAAFLLSIYKDAAARIDSITVETWADDAWTQNLPREIGDSVSVIRTPTTHPVTGSQTITQASLIESVQHTGQPAINWTTTYELAASPTLPVAWKLGTSALGSSTILAYV